MFGEFTVPAELHDIVYFDLVERGYIPIDEIDTNVVPHTEEDVPL